jgi:hypothetical protein
MLSDNPQSCPFGNLRRIDVHRSAQVGSLGVGLGEVGILEVEISAPKLLEWTINGLATFVRIEFASFYEDISLFAFNHTKPI